jgi:hypothetical protein
MTEPIFFESARDLSAWLRALSASATELIIG